jgi:flagellar biosynthetic protein FliR
MTEKRVCYAREIIMDFSIVLGELIKFLLVLTRISALVLSMPVIGSEVIPPRIKIGISAVVALLITQNIAQPALDNIFSLNAVFCIAFQLIIGIIIGMVWHLMFEAFSCGGQIIAMQIGLGFAMMNDPQSKVSVPVVSQFYLIILTLLFFSADLHILIIKVIIDSFAIMPIDGSFQSIDYEAVIGFSSLIFVGALSLALPSVVSLLTVNLGFGLMSKFSPQLNIFTLGFSMSLIFGVFIIYFSVGSSVDIFNNIVSKIFNLINNIIIADVGVMYNVRS